MLKVTVLRGLPGSGKSTYANKIKEGAGDLYTEIFSADDFHMEDGKYNWKLENVGKAHAWCLKGFIRSVSREKDANPLAGSAHIIVDNTNCAIWEMAPYCAVAIAYGADLVITTFECSVETAIKRNVHNVPPETIRRMNDTLEKHSVLIPKHWKHVLVNPS